MKNLIISISVLFLFIFSVSSQSGWHPMSTGIQCSWYSAYFIDANTGFLCGWGPGGGGIAKTTNAGGSWTQVYINQDYIFRSVYFFNSNTGFVSGRFLNLADSGAVLRTTNGGVNWEITLTRQIICLSFPAVNTVYGAGGSPSIVYKTTDNGNNWTQQNVPGGASFLLGTYFLNSNTGWAVGNSGVIIKTEDGGNNWVQQNSGTGFSINNVYFINSNTGIAVGGTTSYGVIIRTTNGGNNWDYVNIDPVCNLWSVRFSSAETGYITGWCGEILRTVDGGASWCELLSGQTEVLEWNCFTSANTGYVVGFYDIVLKTTDGGGNCINGLQNSSNEIPDKYKLLQNYPNPFNPVTNIKFDLPHAANVKLSVFDILGKEVEVLVNEFLKPGTYNVDWNASNYPSGTYFYSVTSGNFAETKKMILIK